TEDGTQFELDFGSIKRSGTRDVSFLVESKLGVPLIFDYVKPSCNVCTSSSFEKVNNHQVRIKLKLDVEKISLGDFRKSLHIGYYLKSKYDKQTLKLVGTLNE
ncbi:MAG: hypothetical protein PQJ49_08090, partial [Sphaerochaetaceae bacterium]|nr:hypothetical protein [Sphaerochaetaceae bacterium]